MAWRRLALMVLIVAPILWLLAFGFGRDARHISSPLVAKEAAPFSVMLFNSEEVSLEDLRGKAVFLNFWASWCAPCRAEARDLEAAWQAVKERDNVVFIGVALQDTEKASRAFLEEFAITYPNGTDPSGRIAVEYGVWGIPESFFIDPEGRITYKHAGAIGSTTVISKLEEAARGIVSAKEGRRNHQSVR